MDYIFGMMITSTTGKGARSVYTDVVPGEWLDAISVGGEPGN